MAGGGIGSGLGAPTGFAQPMTGRHYNQRLMQGETNEQIRASQAGLFGKDPSDAQWNQTVTQAGLESGRPLPGSAQFYQPVYQPQYQNYAMTNPMGVSQYGQGFGGGYGGYGGYGGGIGGGIGGGGYSGRFGGGFMPPMQTPFSQPQQADSGKSSLIGNDMPYSPGMQPISDMGDDFIGRPRQGQVDSFANTMGSLFGMPTARGNFGSMGASYPNSFQTPFSYPQQMQWDASSEIGIGSFMRDQLQQPQQPQTNYGPSQQIVSRSSSMRGTPNVMMRRAEGGIASLVDDE